MASMKVFMTVTLLVVLMGSAFAQDIKVTNIEVKSGKDYQLGPGVIEEGANYFIDRDHNFGEIPNEIEGALYIMGANSDDKNGLGPDFLTFEVDQPVRIWICRDSRGDPVKGGVIPQWLGDDFESTEIEVAVNGDDNMGFFILYQAKEDHPAGAVSLGGNADVPAAGQGTNYVALIMLAENATSVEAEDKLATTWGELKKAD